MPTRPVPYETILDTVRAYHEALDEGWPVTAGTGQRGALRAAADTLEMMRHSAPARIANRLDYATALGVQVRSWRAVDPDFANKTLLRYRAYDEEYRVAESRLTRPAKAPSSSMPQAGHLPGGQRARTAPTYPTAARKAAEESVAQARASREAESKAAVKRERGARVEPVPTTVVASPPELTLEELAAKVVPILRRGPLTFQELAEKMQVSDFGLDGALTAAHAAGANFHLRGGK